MGRQFAGLLGGLILAWQAKPARRASDPPAVKNLRADASRAARDK
ncbi:MAG TPA: hypothetical protein VLA64_13725 [Azonexus sp.]|nr:hypothetical protein [Azonexus sp.]